MTLIATNTLSIFDPAARANPQAVYARMRLANPISAEVGPMSGNTFWFFTRYNDVLAVLKDQRFGKNIREKLPMEIVRRFMPEEPDPMFAIINRHLLELDPPDHTRLRALVHKAFTPRAVQDLQPRIQHIAEDLLEGMKAKPDGDLIADYAFPLPVIVIAEMLGVSPADRNKFREWTNALLFGMDDEKARFSVMEFMQYMNERIEEREKEDKGDILSGLVQAKEGGDKLDRIELLSMIFLLLVAGHETTVNLIGNGMLALMQHPEQMHKLQQNPELIKSAVEEILRYNGPVETTTWRWALEDVEIGGVVIPQGDVVLPSLLAANRDPDIFPNPDIFDITRNPNPHVAFGAGIHYCIGAPLARMEGTIAINALLAQHPHIHLNAPIESLHWNHSLLLHGMKALPVVY
jgi:cytochrome P450 PksS